MCDDVVDEALFWRVNCPRLRNTEADEVDIPDVDRMAIGAAGDGAGAAMLRKEEAEEAPVGVDSAVGRVHCVIWRA